ncbi:radical SAM protein [Enorma massiliensis]|uniref:radical SAM protein n=1 Tax=Enorma massiliensis TaxID=1472761 RepID=UPI00195DA9C5|nr:radical SAM protein [Enorma massiliensis]MBM6892110.1 radical SAM protein [Enorma massiliensis]
MALTQKAERAALNKLIDYLDENPEEHIPQIMELIDKLVPAPVFPAQRTAISSAIRDRSNWYELIMRIFHLNPSMRSRLLKTLIVDANLLAWPVQQKSREREQCNIPWAILLDPTSACNLHCTGCWAAEYGHALNLSYDDICSIIDQGRELGTHIYIYTGGEPMVRKRDLIRICEKYPDCAFLCFTNATLIDEEFCEDMIRVANFIPAISAEGTEATTDARRGKGTYAKIMRAMELLRGHGLPFGISACWTSANADAIASERYFDWMIDQGALFCWFFHYMPVGKGSPAELMPTVEQRERMYRFVREMRNEKPLFTLDFQNDGEYVGGCIAGGRRYLHINAAGDVEPCVFIHYANANIHDVSLLEALKSPLFMKYYEGQPFNQNHLRPCPMLENPERLGQMVQESGAHGTDLVEPESPSELRAKTEQRAREWEPVANRLWGDEGDEMFAKRHDPYQGMDDIERKKFQRLGRDVEAERAATFS